MGVISKPYSFSAGAVIVSSEINSDFDTLYAEFNGNIDDNNIKSGANINGSKLLNASIASGKLIDGVVSDAKIDYTSAKIIKPNIVGLKFARGGKAYSLTAGGVTITITFSTDSDDGDPQFGATPRIICTPVHSGNSITFRTKSKSNTSFQVDLTGTGSESGTLEWFAVGV